MMLMFGRCWIVWWLLWSKFFILFLNSISFTDEFLYRVPEVIEWGFNIPTFNTHTSSVDPKIGEALHDCDRRICGVIFCDQIGKFPWTLPLYKLWCCGLAAICPCYQLSTSKLPWKHFKEVATREHICIENYPDDVMPPGPDFDLKKLSPADLQLLVGPYITAVQAKKEVAGTSFYMTKWSQGTSQHLFIVRLC